MSAVQAVHAALLGALGGHAAFRSAVNGIYEGGTIRATPPYAVVGESVARDWGFKDVRGREVRVQVSVIDIAERPERLQRIAGHAEDAIAAMPRSLDGWHVASVAFLGARASRGAKGNARAVVEYRVRVTEANDGG